MKLSDFIKRKEEELLSEYRKVELVGTESVRLSTGSVGRQFNSNDTDLHIEGEEVNIHRIPDNTSLNFTENGTLVQFDVLAKGKRKPVNVEFYFLWKVD